MNEKIIIPYVLNKAFKPRLIVLVLFIVSFALFAMGFKSRIKDLPLAIIYWIACGTVVLYIGYWILILIKQKSHKEIIISTQSISIPKSIFSSKNIRVKFSNIKEIQIDSIGEETDSTSSEIKIKFNNEILVISNMFVYNQESFERLIDIMQDRTNMKIKKRRLSKLEIAIMDVTD